MPTISVFYGIRIYFNLKNKEHEPPHVHAEYGEHEATFTLNDGELHNGSFPGKGKSMVKEFILQNKSELQKMWETGEYKKLKGLE